MFVHLSYKIMVSQIAGPFLEDDLGKQSIIPHLWSIWLLTTPFEACDMSNITFLLNLRNSPPLVAAYVLLKIHHIEQNIHPVGQPQKPKVNSGISACERAERWSNAIQLLEYLTAPWHWEIIENVFVRNPKEQKLCIMMFSFHPFWWLNWLWWSLGYAVRSLKCACYEVLRLAGSVLTYNSVLDGCVTGLQGSWTKRFGHHLCVFWYSKSIIYRIYPMSRDPFPARVARSPLF